MSGLTKLKILQARQKTYFSRLQQTFDLIPEVENNPQARNNFLIRFQTLTSTRDQFHTLVEEIAYLEMEINPETTPNFQAINAFDELYGAVIIANEKLKLSLQMPPLAATPSVPSAPVEQRAKLPAIKIKPFTGKVQDWPEFRDMFSAVIDSHKNLSDAEKYYYLRTSLESPALKVISGYPPSSEHYRSAFTALQERFENKRLLATHFFEELFSSEKPPLFPSSNLFQLFLSQFNDAVVGLQNLNIEDLSDFIVLNLALRRLDPQSRKSFEKEHVNAVIPKYADLVVFIKNQLKIYEFVNVKGSSSVTRTEPSHPKSNTKRVFLNTTSHPPSSHTSPTSSRPSFLCPLCNLQHQLYRCPQFKALTSDQRINKIKMLKACSNCLSLSHRLERCGSTSTCFRCGKLHHTLLHFESRTEKLGCTDRTASTSSNKPPYSSFPAPSASLINYTKTQDQVNFTQSHLVSPQSSHILLGTLVFRIIANDGSYVSARALIDPGSTRSCITAELVSRLGAKITPTHQAFVGLGNTPVTPGQGFVSCTIMPQHQLQPCFITEAIVLPNIIGPTPPTAIPDTLLQVYQHLPLADPSFGKPGPIDFLLGADLFLQILAPHSTKFPNQGVLNTVFGVVIMGPLPNKPPLSSTSPCLTTRTDGLADVSQRFWEIEEISSTPISNPDDDICKAHFVNNHRHTAHGRYDATTQISLLQAKSKVAPLKKSTIPRLELSGALLLSRAIASIRVFLSKLTAYDVHLYTDSTVVLSWLHKPTYSLKTYVANRVETILELTDISQWNHISTHHNPADIVSRGLLPDALSSCLDWYHGPAWMQASPVDWPVSSWSPVPKEDLPELKSNDTILLSSLPPDCDVPWMVQCSTFNKIIRVQAYVLRFLSNCRDKTRTHRKFGPLTILELRAAHSKCVFEVQSIFFLKDIKLLSSGKPTSSHLLPLSPFLDESLLLRVGGRIKFSTVPFTAKHPLLLPKHSHFTHTLIEHSHRVHLHAGPRTLRSILQHTYWILSAHSVIRQRLRLCTVCSRFSAPCYSPRMADLPYCRVTPSRVFNQCGIDLAGPYFIKESTRRNSRVFKSYFALFICMATKAVHLEALSSLTTEAFLATLSRFVSRRGLPSDIYCDQATNFRGGARELKEVVEFLRNNSHQILINEELAKQNIKFHFICPHAPFMGGIWESNIKNVKYHFNRVIGKQVLTFEEFSTILVRIEAVLNSRPLSNLSSSPNEHEALTPGHFLVGAPLVAVPEHPLTHLPINRLSRWQLVTQLAQHFWKRWSNEYLLTLQQRSKWFSHPSPNLKSGQLVWIKEDNSSPLSYPLGRIEEIFPNTTDGTVRVVSVRTSQGLLKRPVRKLAPLLL